MYKKRINKWGLDKKNKEKEMKAIICKEKNRTLQGKLSTFRTRGRPVEYKDVVRYWERRRISIDDVIASCNVRGATPDTLECITPVLSPVSTPAVLATPERILRVTSDYCHGSFESGIRFSRDPRLSCVSVKDKVSLGSPSLRLYDEICAAALLFHLGKFREAGQVLISGTAIIKRILLIEDPMTIPVVFTIIAFLQRYRRPEIGTAVMRQMTNLGEVILCQQHPITQITALLPSLDLWQQKNVTDRAFKGIGNHFERQLGFTHYATMQVRQFYYDAFGDEDGQRLNQRCQALQDEIQRDEALFGPQDFRCISLHIYLVGSYLMIGQFAEAEREARCLLQAHPGVYTDSLFRHSYGECLRLLALAHLSQNKIDAGEAYGREYVNFRMSYSNKYDPQVRAFMAELEGHLVKAGRQESAMQIEQWRIAILAAELGEDATISEVEST